MAITARGVIARVPGAPAEVEEFTIDDPGPNEVLVRILASGVCHTDLGVKMGTYGTDGFPFLLGHEGAGIVEAVGPGVESPQVGDHVIMAWRAPCGNCRFCRAGQPNYCANSLNAEKRMRGKMACCSIRSSGSAPSAPTRSSTRSRRSRSRTTCPRRRCR